MPTETRTADVIAIGSSDSPEFADLRLLMLSRLPQGFRGVWQTIPDYLAAPAAQVPDMAVVWQSTPDEFPPDQIAALLARLPLSRVLCVSGPWCAAAGRSAPRWPGALCVPVWQAATRFVQELRALSEPGIVALPWTAGREELWLRDVLTTAPAVITGVRVALDCPDPVYRDLLVELVTAAGGEIDAADSAADVVVIDVEPWTPEQHERLADGRHRHPEAVVVAVSGWTTHDLQTAVMEQGGDAVVSKLDPDALLQTIAEISATA